MVFLILLRQLPSLNLLALDSGNLDLHSIKMAMGLSLGFELFEEKEEEEEEEEVEVVVGLFSRMKTSKPGFVFPRIKILLKPLPDLRVSRKV